MTSPSVRERLRAAAFELFDEHGYEETTVSDIADRAGVGRTTVFRHFASKESLVFPEHDEILAAISRRLTASTLATAPIAVWEAARLVLQHYLAEGELARSRYRLTSTVPALREHERASAHRYQLVFRAFIQDWMGGEPDAPLRADLMAGSVIVAHNHVLRRWLRHQTTSPEQEFDAAMTCVLEMFATAPAKPPDDFAVVVLHTDRTADVVLAAIRAALGNSPGPLPSSRRTADGQPTNRRQRQVAGGPNFPAARL